MKTHKINGEELHVVGIGASAGGIEAFEELFSHFPTDSGLGFVIIQHLDPTHESILPEIIGRYTDMPVSQVTERTNVEPNHIYVIAPGTNLAILNNELHVVKPESPRGLRLSVDFFFRSLAEDKRERAIGIILSGTGSDGTLGIKAIKGVGGLTVAQDPETARYEGMPLSAIKTDMVDIISSLEKMPDLVTDYYENFSLKENEEDDENLAYLQSILGTVRDEVGHDFTQYKETTLKRRIERRMIVNRINSWEAYRKFLNSNPMEINELYRDFLIGVTNFFRDLESFRVLETLVFPDLFKDKDEEEPLRIWVPGCSTGEEAISLMVLLYEYMEAEEITSEIQMFATDIDERAINYCRTGIYPNNIVLDIPDKYLQKYFIRRDDDRFEVVKKIRRSVVYAEQSVVKDPPFSNIDFISCRNMLIYMNARLQETIIRTFHYSLKPRGFLFLGSSENIMESGRLFDPVSYRHRIFRKLYAPDAAQILLSDYNPSSNYGRKKKQKQKSDNEIQRILESTLLERYAPPSVVVNQQGDIQYYQGDTSLFWKPDDGSATLNILRLVRQELRTPITIGLRKALISRKMVVFDNIRLGINDKKYVITISLYSVSSEVNSNQKYAVISFDKRLHIDNEYNVEGLEEGAGEPYIAKLEQELRLKDEYLQSIIEELETSNEELKSINEEYQSSNEELRSANEELETSREELKALNEELLTVNSELNENIDELKRSYTDQSNMFDNIDIGILFLDGDNHIRLFNPVLGKLLNLVRSDVGRPISHFSVGFENLELAKNIHAVLNTLQPVSKTVRSNDGIWYHMHIRPYRTDTGNIDGTVLTFNNIHERKIAQDIIDEQRKLYSLILRSLPKTIVLIFDKNFTYQFVEGNAFANTSLARVDLLGNNLFKIPELHQDDELVKAHKKVFQSQESDIEVLIDDECFDVRVVPLFDQDGQITRGLLVGWDSTNRKKLEEDLERANHQYRLLIEQLPFVSVLVFDKELRYTSITGHKMLKEAGFEPDKMIDRTIKEVLPEESLKTLEPIYRETLAGQTQTTTRTKDGRTYKGHFMPIYGEDEQEIIAGMLVVRDVTLESSSEDGAEALP